MSVKNIAFYLPQFHPIPENDKAHGMGFTEWTNTRKAKPLFEGHYQPRTPLGENYYNLLDKDTMRQQAKLAKEKGIYGFCYYHYWFKDGKKLLEKPVEQMLEDPLVDIPFCLCWANENWTKRWDGGNNNIIVYQDYGDFEDLRNHVDYLCTFFADERYIKDNGAPLLLIYKPELIPNLKKVIKFIRNRAKENGFPKIKIVVQYPKYILDRVRLSFFDAFIQFEPKFIYDYQVESNKAKYKVIIKRLFTFIGIDGFEKTLKKIFKKKETEQTKRELTIRDYDKDWEQILNYPVKDSRMIAGAFVDWDNTPRNTTGLAYKGATPEKFGVYMKRLIEKVENEYTEKYIFINAWNEWAEGAYLEADEKYGYGYIDALNNAMESVYGNNK